MRAATELVFASTSTRARSIAIRSWVLLRDRGHDTDRVGYVLGTIVQSGEHLVVTMDHWKDDGLPKVGELPIRHLQGRLQFVDSCLPLVLWQERKVPAHLCDGHRTVHFVYGSVGLIKQRPGISCKSIGNGSQWANSFRTTKRDRSNYCILFYRTVPGTSTGTHRRFEPQIDGGLFSPCLVAVGLGRGH
jgi:hypothetical protein